MPSGLCIVTKEAVRKQTAMMTSLREIDLEYLMKEMEEEDPILVRHLKDLKSLLLRKTREHGDKADLRLQYGAYMIRRLLHTQTEMNGERLSRISQRAIECFNKREEKGMRERGEMFGSDEYKRIHSKDPLIVECISPGYARKEIIVGGAVTYFIYEQQAIINREQQQGIRKD